MKLKFVVFVALSILLVLAIALSGFSSATFSGSTESAGQETNGIGNNELESLVSAPPVCCANAYPSRPMPIVGAPKWNTHLRVPANDLVIEQLLRDSKFILKDASPDDVKAAVEEFKRLWAKRQPTTPNPEKFRQLLENERRAAQLGKSPKAMGLTMTDPPIKTLVALVEFTGSDTFTYSAVDPIMGKCVDVEVTTSGPLHNEIPSPGPRDNFTVWYENATPELYDELYFGTGPDAGMIINHPNLGAVDCRGLTVANYYLEQSEGAFAPEGYVYPKWLQSAHSEGWYGADSCEADTVDRNPEELTREVVDLINADDPDFPWQEFDADGDGIVDNFTAIHGGMGQEAGGGLQGEFAIWSHAGLLDWPTGYLACAAGSEGCPDRDIYVLYYSMDPENYDVGVGAEEYGHAAFGLPDLYTSDAQTSIANWSIMEAGGWNGPLGGMQPAPFPSWFRYVVGWWDPVEVDYDTEQMEVVVGQHSLRPLGTEQGVKINLPDKDVYIPNPLDTGQAWWSDVGDLLLNTLTRQFDLRGATAPVTFSFNSYWSIEEDWDYGYMEVSDDGGVTWTILDDMDDFFTDTNPNGNNEGWGLTGEGAGTLRFDLSTYAGMEILLRLRYSTDLAVQGEGWWGDDFSLDDATGNLFLGDVEAGPGEWIADGWRIVPDIEICSHYYLVEWRNLTGFDEGLQYAYEAVWFSPTEFEVDRAPYTVPGALVWLRDSSYAFDYTLSDSLTDPPSLGPKHGLIVVDSHPLPYMWDYYYEPTGQNALVHGRVQPADATFTLQETTPFTVRLGYDPETGGWLEESLETKTFGPRPPVSQYHDSMGYYPGLWFCDPEGYLLFWDIDASAVVPASDDYTTKVTWPDYSPAYELYGTDLDTTVLGSGHPGDDRAQYGLHMRVMDQAEDGSWGKLAFWNSMDELYGSFDMVVPAEDLSLGDTLNCTVDIEENIGGGRDPFMVLILLPPEVEYVPDSAFGGAIPVGSSIAPGEVAKVYANGSIDAVWSPSESNEEVRAIVWFGDIPTAEGVNPFGFSAELKIEDGDISMEAVLFKVSQEKPFQRMAAAVRVRPPNSPPNMPSSPSPAKGGTDISVDADLTWAGGDPDPGDTVTYDVYFGTNETPPLVSSGQTATTYDPGILSYSTKHYWKIVATDNYDAVIEGPLWDFTTEAPGDNPPVAIGLDSIRDWLEVVYGFDDGEWTWYNPSWPPEANTLTTLYMGSGYWINVSEDCVLTYGANTYELDAGWNLVGWLGYQEHVGDNPDVATGLESIMDCLVVVYGFDNATKTWTWYNPSWPAEANTLTVLYMGGGYWINVSELCDLIYEANTYELHGGWNLIGWLGW